MSDRHLLVVIVGPTAVGKTSVSIALADQFKGDIISCDSRQFYKEMEIGTAKPDAKELAAVNHHFIDTHSIKEPYDAGAFASDADRLLEELFGKNPVQFMVGGSGLYVKAFCEGLDDMPEADFKLREELNDQYKTEGLDNLLIELEKVDPQYYQKVDRKNPQRVIRGLEVVRSTGRPYSEFRLGGKKKTHSFDILKIGLAMDREDLYERIDRRMDQMIAQGLFEEAQQLYPFKDFNALQTVGYKEIFDFIDGYYDKNEAIRLLKRNSRRYAKRQMTWFNRDSDIHWFDTKQFDKMTNLIQSKL